jgi:P27 family predicted phage terminase small subunit
MQQDHRPDAMMLEMGCVNYQRAVQADSLVAKEGIIVEEPIKYGEKVVLKRKHHPAIAISRAAWDKVRQFSGEFGLSPVSRARLAIEKQNTGEADLAAILTQPRAPRVAPTVN